MPHGIVTKVLALVLAFTVFATTDVEAVTPAPTAITADDPPPTGARPIPHTEYPGWDGETGLGEPIDPRLWKLVADIAQLSEEPEVREAAQAALDAGTEDAIWEFLDTGEVEAQQRAQARRNETARLNREAVLDLRGTGGPIFNAEVERVLAGSDADRAAFLDYGKGIAAERDERNRRNTQARADELRARVTALSGSAGPEVKLAAQQALAAGDTAIVAFFNGGYVAAAQRDAAAREQYLKDLEERNKAAEAASDLAQRAARASRARQNLLAANGRGVRALQRAANAMVSAGTGARQAAQILAANTVGGHHSPESFSLVRQEVLRQLDLAGQAAADAQSASVAATAEANILIEAGLPYGADWARLAQGMSAAAQAAVLAIRTAQHALDATMATDAAIGHQNEAAARAEEARQWRLHAEEHARQADALALAASDQAVAATNSAERARQARRAAEAARDQASEGLQRTYYALLDAEREAGNARTARQEAERQRDEAARYRAQADQAAAEASRARGEAEAKKREAAAYLARARAQEDIAAGCEDTARREESNAKTARDLAWQAQREGDAAEARAQALEASAAAARGTEQEAPAWAAAREARADATDAANAARAARDAANRATGAAARAREAATKATAAAAASRAAAQEAETAAANADLAADKAESAAADTHVSASRANAAAATATAEEVKAAANVRNAAGLAEQATEQARLATVDAVRAGQSAGESFREAVSAATQAGLAGRAALAARASSAAITAPANTAIVVTAPFTGADLDADFVAEVAAQAQAAGAEQAQAAQDRANEARLAADRAQQAADNAAADTKAAFQAAANAAASAAWAAQSVANAARAAADAAREASFARDAAETANGYDVQAHDNAAKARQKANEASADAAIAGLAADAAEGQAAAARTAATKAETDAAAARAAATKAEGYAAEAAAAAERARVHAQNTSDAAQRARDAAVDAQHAADQAEADQRQREADHRQLENLIASGCLPNLTIQDADLLNSDPEGRATLAEYRAAAADCLNGKDLTDFLLEAGAEVLLEFIGVEDLKRCLGEGDVASCLWTVVNVVGLVLPFVKGKAIVKAIGAVIANIGKWVLRSERIEKLAAKVLSILNRLHKYCSWLSVLGGAGGFAPAGTRAATSPATTSDIPDFGCGMIPYDSDLLSQTAFEARVAMGFFDADHNVAVAYVPGWTDGPYPNMVVASSSMSGHSETDILGKLAAKGFSPNQIQALYTDRAPCKACQTELANALRDNKTVKISWAVPWGTSRVEQSSAKEVLKGFIDKAKRRRGIGFSLKIVIDPDTAPTTPPGHETLPLALATPPPTGRRP
ncbi:nucleic acid/nucleotide deaminase domain-containing protein [Amycolatopsis sp. NEAU-NG30]|uniref:Nucleic acid/nucleotide deaminase domain-containing protein n=1 Tax=Amycolatopsis melonis TaxID=3156488 RepID=A0ABV0L8H6_9PSEU